MSHVVAQKVTLMTQLNIHIITAYDESSSCTNEGKRLPFMQKCSSRFVASNFLKKITYVVCDECCLLCFCKVLEDERCQFKMIYS